MSTSAAETSAAGRIIPEWSLGDRLRKVRRLAGLSQTEFAEKLGGNQKTYAAWELDTQLPRNTVAIAKRIEALTGVPTAWVLGIDSPELGHGVVTRVETGEYRPATSPRRTPLALVTSIARPHRDVSARYGSRSTNPGQHAWPHAVRSAGAVNSANTA